MYITAIASGCVSGFGAARPWSAPLFNSYNCEGTLVLPNLLFMYISVTVKNNAIYLLSVLVYKNCGSTVTI